ncbi:hypothetical protein [Mycobacterium sp. 1274756.6]|uniref:hypothetical protein n=1 Tax=Mycobacterium sp. 1274756.6 TaxID=1834076 RepID=UPI000B2D723D|nr:hypothetical protein [Mycobacterium sp. 1274756.6]
MASQPMGSGSPRPAPYGLTAGMASGATRYGHTNPATCNRSYLMAGLRAGLIALVLLILFTLLVLL